MKRDPCGSPPHIRPIKYIARSGVSLAEFSGCSNDGDPKGNLHNHLAIPQFECSKYAHLALKGRKAFRVAVTGRKKEMPGKKTDQILVLEKLLQPRLIGKQEVWFPARNSTAVA